MAANTGKYFGNNFVKGWKKSFDIKGNTNYADYSSFLGFNFGLILVLSFLTWKVSEAYFFCLIIYLFADIFPMTSITLRRLIDSGNSRKNIFYDSERAIRIKCVWSIYFCDLMIIIDQNNFFKKRR